MPVTYIYMATRISSVNLSRSLLVRSTDPEVSMALSTAVEKSSSSISP